MRLFEMLRDMFSTESQGVQSGSTEAHSGATSAEDLGGLKVVELKALARERGLRGYSKLNKSQLLQLLS